MPPAFRIIGFARREKTDESWRDELRDGAGPVFPHEAGGRRGVEGIRGQPVLLPGRFDRRGRLHKAGRAAQPSAAAPLRHNLLFYLATQPSQFGEVAEQLHDAELLHKAAPRGWQRIVVEKPFGHDLASARR